MYDIRASRPYHVQDHHYGLPINSIAFHSDQELVLSTDSKALKIWHRDKVWVIPAFVVILCITAASVV